MINIVCGCIFLFSRQNYCSIAVNSKSMSRRFKGILISTDPS